MQATKQKKTMFAVTNHEGDYFERLFKTLEDAFAHLNKRLANYPGTNSSMKVMKLTEDFKFVDYVLEGEGSKEFWESI
jgi:hypothetical protein